MSNVNKLTPYSDGKRRKMAMTKLTAVALTGRGANPEANVTFFKSHKGGENVNKAGDLVDLLTSVEDGHQHGIKVEIYNNELYINVMYATEPDDEFSHYHALARDGGGFAVSANNGHSHTVDADLISSALLAQLSKGEAKDTITKEQADLLTAVNLDGIENLEDAMSKELEASLAAANKKVAEQAVALKLAETVASFTPTAKAFFDTLGTEDQKSFVGKTDADRVATMEMAKSANPVVYTSKADGTEFRKSDGAAMVSMAKRIDTQDSKIAKQDALNKHSVLVKRASDEMSNLTGKDVAKIALLGAIDTIEDEGIRKEVAAIIKASNSSAAAGLETLGSQEPAEIKKAEEKLDALAKEYATEHKVDENTAYVKVLETEAGQELYNEANA